MGWGGRNIYHEVVPPNIDQDQWFSLFVKRWRGGFEKLADGVGLDDWCGLGGGRVGVKPFLCWGVGHDGSFADGVQDGRSSCSAYRGKR